MNFLDRCSKNTETSNFMKIRLVGAELLHAGRRTWWSYVVSTFRNFKDAPETLYEVDVNIEYE